MASWFFNWPQCSTGRSSISTASSKRYLHHTRWWHLFCHTRPHRGLLTSQILCNLQRTTDDKHSSWPIPISVVTILGKNSPSYFPTNHGHYANRSRGCSGIHRWHHCCRPIKRGVVRMYWQSSDTHSKLWVPASTWKCHFYLQEIKY